MADTLRVLRVTADDLAREREAEALEALAQALQTVAALIGAERRREGVTR